MNLYVLTNRYMDTVKVISCFQNKKDAIMALHQYYDQLNAPSKIIWQNDLCFKIISDNGQTNFIEIKQVVNE